VVGIEPENIPIEIKRAEPQQALVSLYRKFAK
jgi:hypothetical protein